MLYSAETEGSSDGSDGNTEEVKDMVNFLVTYSIYIYEFLSILEF